MLPEKRLDALYSLLEEMTLATRRNPDIEPSPRMRWIERILMILYVAVLLMLVGLACWYRVVDGRPPRERPVAIDLFYITSLLIPVVYLSMMTFEVVRIMWNQRGKRFSAILATLKSDLLGDADFLARLSAFDPPTLRYALVQYRHRWGIFDSRMTLVGGDLRKVGLLPALTAASMAASTLLKDGDVSLLWAPLILACSFYVIGFVAAAKRERPEQVVRLLEYAVEQEQAREAVPARRVA